MNLFQKVNHFPGMFTLSRKNYLASNLNKMRKIFPENYDFYPQTWSLPSESADIINQFQIPHNQSFIEVPNQPNKSIKGLKNNPKVKKNDELTDNNIMSTNNIKQYQGGLGQSIIYFIGQTSFEERKKPIFILKPQASSQGKGISSVTSAMDIPVDEKCIVQKYISDPFLIDGLKFDLRIYVLILGCDPLRLFIFKNGLARFATEDYEVPNEYNKDNRFKHLTNYAINKDHPDFEQNKDAKHGDVGHKRSLEFVWDYLRQHQYSPEIIWSDIKKLA